MTKHYAESDAEGKPLREFSYPDARPAPVPADGHKVREIKRLTKSGETAYIDARGAYRRKAKPKAKPTMDDIRRRRDRLLQRSDSQYNREDKGEDWRASWGAYRQSLRDLPATNSDPAKIIWPKPPESNE